MREESIKKRQKLHAGSLRPARAFAKPNYMLHVVVEANRKRRAPSEPLSRLRRIPQSFLSCSCIRCHAPLFLEFQIVGRNNASAAFHAGNAHTQLLGFQIFSATFQFSRPCAGVTTSKRRNGSAGRLGDECDVQGLRTPERNPNTACTRGWLLVLNSGTQCPCCAVEKRRIS